MAQALNDPKWHCAMLEECDTLVQNGTWELVLFAPMPNLIEYKWIFGVKQHFDGSIDKYKTPLVAKGFHQWLRVKYHNTLSPVVKPWHYCI